MVNPVDVADLDRCELLKKWQINEFGTDMVTAIAKKPKGKKSV